MRILISGASGMAGSALVPFLQAGGHEIARLVRRRPAREGAEVFWDPEGGQLDPAALDGFDGVVHLAGESIASGRWTARKKARIRDSRVLGTRLLSEGLARAARGPRVLVSASAVGYYGSRGDELLTEESSSGSGFLAEVCRDWEAATQPAAERGIRVVILRFGVILSATGGALKKMLVPFRMGVGGRVGDGRQHMSWIAIDDALEVVRQALAGDSLSGPVNAVTPAAVTNAEFARILGRVLSRPAVMPMPAFAARLAFGELADELLLSSQRVQPKRLIEKGHVFRFPELEGALRHLLGNR
jgi:uncharacterized protein (TIGR01777 family)